MFGFSKKIEKPAFHSQITRDELPHGKLADQHWFRNAVKGAKRGNFVGIRTTEIDNVLVVEGWEEEMTQCPEPVING